VQFAQDGDCLVGEWDKVRLAHFHAFRGDVPLAGVEVELRPFGLAQFAGTHEQEWGELECATGDKLAVIGVDRAEQSVDGGWIGDG